jgi:hypothetical protein
MIVRKRGSSFIMAKCGGAVGIFAGVIVLLLGARVVLCITDTPASSYGKTFHKGDVVEGYQIVERIDFLGYKKHFYLDESNYNLHAQSVRNILPAPSTREASDEDSTEERAEHQNKLIPGKIAHVEETAGRQQARQGDGDEALVVLPSVKLSPNSRYVPPNLFAYMHTTDC